MMVEAAKVYIELHTTLHYSTVVIYCIPKQYSSIDSISVSIAAVLS